jgi:glycosyltransferase involved in cell wall biosynthesis
LRVACLIPSFQPYRVPVFDVMHEELGEDFTVFTLSDPPQRNDRLGLKRGNFNRRLVKGRYVPLAPLEPEGLQTPTNFVLGPGFPFALREYDPDVVIAMNYTSWTVASLAMGYPTVIFWEGTRHTERTVGRWRRGIRRQMTRRAEEFVVCGPLAEEYLVEVLKAPQDRVRLGGTAAAPPPPDYRDLGPRSVEGDEPVRFLFVGQLIGRKGVKHLLSSVAELKSRPEVQRPFEVLLAGDGPRREELEAQARDLGIDDVVKFLGFMSYDDVWDLYAKSHVFIMPTLQDHWPLVVPEAMSMGLPMMISHFSGNVPEFVHDDRNGFVLDPLDYAAIAEKMATYISDPGQVERHSRQSLEMVAPYTPEWAADGFLSAAADVYARRKQGSS